MDWHRLEEEVVALVVATEVPPIETRSPVAGKPTFTRGMVEPAVRAVIDVIRNRVRTPVEVNPQFRDRAIEVVLWPRAFSAVGREDYFARAASGHWFASHVERCLQLWREEWQDTTGGATHYYSPVRMNPPGTAPAWAPAMERVTVEGVDPWWFTFLRRGVP